MKSLVERLAGSLDGIRKITSPSLKPINPDLWVYMRTPGKPSLDLIRGKWHLKMAAEIPGGDSAGTMLGLFLIARGKLEHRLLCGTIRPTIHGAIRAARRVEVDIIDGCQSALNIPIVDARKRYQQIAAGNSLPPIPVLTPLAQRIGVAMMHEEILSLPAPAEQNSAAVVITQDRSGLLVRESPGNKVLSLIGQAVMGTQP